MYPKFFNLKVNPFTAKLNPKFYFPGKCHEEALLHLKYSVSEGEGFTLITGEKGIGKTTICRAYIKRSDDRVKSAFITYSKLSPIILLKKISQEFGIKARNKTLKELTDAFNNFLMQKKTEGKRVVVFLDDAHKHDNDVLEQLRLLSNLETTREKLLQIVLIGRPKLTDLLNSHDLRPLGQRVTVNYHLQPLSEHETFQYILHRIAIAGKGVTIKFDSSAIRQIYNHSKGIPEFINFTCDRVLMASFKTGHKHISGEIVKTALKDLKYNPIHLSDLFKSISQAKSYGVVSILILIFGLLALNQFRDTTNGINPESTRIKLPHESSDSQIQKSQIPIMGNLSQEYEKIVKSYEYEPPQIPEPDESNDLLEDLKTDITYSIQLGAYRMLKYAQDKLNSLNEKGYAPQIVDFEDNEGQIWHTVRVGKYTSRELAEVDAEALTSEDNLDAVVLPSNKF